MRMANSLSGRTQHASTKMLAAGGFDMDRFKLAVIIVVAVFVVSTSPALAISVVVNGQQLSAQPPAVEIGGRVLLPMRTVFEALNATVDWNGATQTATAGVGTASVDGQPVALDVPPRLIAGHTYVPVRFPAEAFGANVGWNQATQTVSISLAIPPGATAPVGAQGVHTGGPLVYSPRNGDRLGTRTEFIVYSPRNGDRLGTRTEFSIKATPGVLQEIWTVVKRADTGEVLKDVPGIRHLPKADGTYQGAIATPRVAMGDRSVKLRYEIHFRNGPNAGDPETVVTCYPND